MDQGVTTLGEATPFRFPDLQKEAAIWSKNTQIQINVYVS